MILTFPERVKRLVIWRKSNAYRINCSTRIVVRAPATWSSDNCIRIALLSGTLISCMARLRALVEATPSYDAWRHPENDRLLRSYFTEIWIRELYTQYPARPCDTYRKRISGHCSLIMIVSGRIHRKIQFNPRDSAPLRELDSITMCALRLHSGNQRGESRTPDLL